MKLKDKDYINANVKLNDIIDENPSILLFLEHFDIDFLVKEKTVEAICNERNISIPFFLTFINMFFGFAPPNQMDFKISDISALLSFLKKSHSYFRDEKYPEIKKLIKRLYDFNKLPEIKFVGKFFDEYYDEVNEHLEYEEKVVFPYFQKLLLKQKKKSNNKFNVKVYKNHHSDIQYKLDELKELLLKHIPLQDDREIRRKIVIQLFELESYLVIHSKIEDLILIPIIESIEEKND